MKLQSILILIPVKINALSIILLFLALTSCHKEENGQLFEPGLISIGFKKEVSIQTAFELVSRENLVIDRMEGFFYTTQLPNDSINFITNKLSIKNYLSLGSNSVRIEMDSVIILSRFRKMDRTNQNDWLNAINSLQLIDLGRDGKYAHIIVQEGSEREWVRHFESNSNLKYA